MLQVHPVMAHRAGNCQLLLGERDAVLVDAGLPFCAPQTVKNLQAALAGRGLNAIILSHSHYDHLVGLPWLRAAFPAVPVYCHPRVPQVLQRPGALQTMHRLSDAAALACAGDAARGAFDEAALLPLQPVPDGRQLPFDGGALQVLYTPGHTQDCLSLDFAREGVAWLAESAGFYNGVGRFQPCFLSSMDDALDSIARLQALGPRRYVIAHAGVVPPSLCRDYLERAQAACLDIAARVEQWIAAGDSTLPALMQRYTDYFWRDELAPLWPRPAFETNAAAQLQTLLRERGGNARSVPQN